jgi:acetylornithine deacetylase
MLRLVEIVDSANFGPTLGCAGALTWEIEISGKTFHSGLPHKAINTIELAHEVCKILSEKFHEKYAKCAFDEQYKFIIGSSFKPTQISVPKGGLNQIPGQVRSMFFFVHFYAFFLLVHC